MSIRGSLLYLAVCTRPDILSALHPLTSHMHACRRILRYLRGTPTLGITFHTPTTTTVPTLHAYVDASYNSTAAYKSPHGVCICLGHPAAAFHSFVRRQTLTTRSTTEAEYVALADAVAELIWLRRLITALGFPPIQPTIIYEDNKSTITMANSTQMGKRTRHISTRHHFILDNIMTRVVTLHHCSTKDMVADILTKPLPGPAFLLLRSQLLGEPSSSTSSNL